MNMEYVLLYINLGTWLFESQSSAAVDLTTKYIPVDRDQSGELLHKNVVDGECSNSTKFHVV